MDGHPLAAVLLDAANGRFPQFDGALQVMPPLGGLAAGLFGFTGHSIITTNLHEEELRSQLPSRDVGAPWNPAFIAWLAQRLNAHCYTPDLVLVAFRAGLDSAFCIIERPDLAPHPRAVMAQRFRRDVRCYSDRDGSGLLTLGLGVCGRFEVSVEVESAQRNRGLGRRLALAARWLIPEGEPVFAGVSPGNAASLRAFLAAGYVPIGSEICLVRGAVRET